MYIIIIIPVKISKGYTVLRLGVVFDSAGVITSHWSPFRRFIGFQSHAALSATSHLCHGLFSYGGPTYLTASLDQYTPSLQLRSSSDSVTVCVLSADGQTLGQRPVRLFVAMGTVCR